MWQHKRSTLMCLGGAIFLLFFKQLCGCLLGNIRHRWGFGVCRVGAEQLGGSHSSLFRAAVAAAVSSSFRIGWGAVGWVGLVSPALSPWAGCGSGCGGGSAWL